MIFKLRAVVFLLLMALTLFPFCAYLAIIARFNNLSRQFEISNAWTRWFVFILDKIAGVKHRVTGMEHLPDGPRIYFSKHQSVWETLAYQTIFPHYVWILKVEALKIPFFGAALSSLKPIAIKRGTGKKAIDQICEQGIARLQEGLGVMIFPEGTRLMPGIKKPFKVGGAVLAKESGALVVPLAHNAGSFWPAKRMLLTRPGTIDVVVGPPIDPTTLTEQEICEKAKEWVDAKTEELENSLASLPG